MFRILAIAFLCIMPIFADESTQENIESPNSTEDSQSSTSEFIEALRGGAKSGDINLLFNFSHDSQTSPKNNAYLATSFGLYYKSAFYGYFRLHLGFRGALALWEQNRNTIFSKRGDNSGKGSASRDFWDKNIAMVARSYLEYFDGDTSVKAGRIEDKTDMIDKSFDGVWISNKSAGWLLVDVIYLHQVGRVLDRELSGFEKFIRYENVNDTVQSKGKSNVGGAYYLGLKFELFEWLKIRAYGLTSPKIYSFVAGKIDISTDYFLLNAGFVGGFEHRNSYFRTQATQRDANGKDNDGRWSYLIHADMGGKYDSQWGLFYATMGYRGTQSKVGIGSLNFTGNSFNPFFYFSGNALENAKELHLVYGKLGFNVDFLDISLAYGYNFFKGDFLHNGTQNNNQGEVNFYMNWRFSDWTSVIIHFLNTHGAKNDVPNNTRFDFMFKVSL